MKTIQEKFSDSKFIVVSNREPYLHTYNPEGEIVWYRPASGLVSALDPVLRSVKGTWIAWGDGEADKEVANSRGEIMVPPDDPTYKLKLIFLDKDEIKGYYDGVSNQMFWPLCHIVHYRPQFSQENWELFKKVNRKFARAILDEAGENKKAFVWLNDYHLALCSKYIKEENPLINVVQFWHIPWPNPEAFRICPWKEEILQGLLANDLLAFHLRYHCDNFLQTVDAFLESRIDRESSAVIYNRQVTKVKPFPISIDFQNTFADAASAQVKRVEKHIERSIKIPHKILAVGVDRLDYIKGIRERLIAIDRFLEKYPEFIGQFLYLGLAYPSRTRLKEFNRLADDISDMVEEINWKYRTQNWYPIIYREETVKYPDVLAYYRLADLCLVSSLHDGMNLVSKEFIASWDGQRPAALILSQFTGAARELTDAILINPYDIEAFADAIYHAIQMPKEEKIARMQRMQNEIKENDIFRWAENFLLESSKISVGPAA